MSYTPYKIHKLVGKLGEFMGTSLKTDGSSRKNVLITSLIFMGLGHIVHFKQYVKGIFYALIEVVFLIFSPTIFYKIRDLIMLGKVREGYGEGVRAYEHFMLIEGMITLVIIGIFAAVYYISVKGALNTYREFCYEGKLKTNRESLSGIMGKSFPIFGLAPTVVLIAFFVVVPLLFSACVAFTDFSIPDHYPPKNPINWIGGDNFVAMFGGNATWTTAFGRVAVWTVIWGVLSTLTSYFAGLIVAVILNESKMKLTPVFRVIFILPYAVPSVISMLVWKNMLNGEFGTINKMLKLIGVEGMNWLTDKSILPNVMCLVVNLWAGFPYFMLLMMGTMTAISSDVFEAAKIDGANKWQIFKSITLPLVIYQTLPLMIMSFTFNINNFGAVYFLTGGQPTLEDTTRTFAGGTDILVTWIYKLTVDQMRYNYGAVLAILVFLVLAPFAIFNFMRTKSFKEGEL